MAQRDRPTNDPNRIDVALEVVGQDGRAAIDDLTKQVALLTQHLATAGSMSPEALAGAAAQRTQSWGGHGTPGREAGSPGASRPPSGPVLDEAGHHASTSWGPDDEYASRPTRPGGRPTVDEAGQHASDPRERDLLREGNLPWYQRVRESFDKERRRERGGEGIISRELSVRAAREREQAARRSLSGGPRDPRLVGINAGNEYDYQGRPSPSASNPGGFVPEPGEPIWRQNLRSDQYKWEAGQEAPVIPQFGELTAQNKLYIGAGFFQRSAERAYQTAVANGQPTDNVGLKRGMAAGLLQQAGEASGQLYPLLGYGRAAHGFLGGMNDAGTSAGFERNGTISLGPLGMYNPFSAAMREGIRQKWNTMRLRMKGGINGQQAAEIVGGLAANGFVGSEGQNLAFDTVAPLVQQGLNPEITTGQLSEAIRNGATPVNEFKRTLEDLGPAARAARMSLDEYQQSLGGFANQMQEMGATYGQGYKLGRNLSTGLNLAPQQVAPLMQNPIVQGMGLRQGYLPQTIGEMGSGEASSAIYGAVDLAWNASNFFDKPIVNPKTGHVTTVDDQRMAQSAQLLGITKDQFEKMFKGERMGKASTTALEALDAYQGARRHYGKEVDPSKSRPEDLIRVSKDTPGAEKIGDHWYINHNTPGNRAKQAALDANTGASGASWTTVNARLHDVVNAGDTKEDRADLKAKVQEISAMDPGKRIGAARKFLEEQSKQDLVDESTPTAYVKFTGEAKKFFAQDLTASKNKRAADAGGEAINSTKVDPRDTDSSMAFLRSVGAG